jgi:hypothetical protein
MASGDSKQTEKTLLRQWQAFEAGDVEAITGDDAEDMFPAERMTSYSVGA